MNKLTNEYISKYYDYFMCSYGNIDNTHISSYESYVPETFFVGQKRNNEKLIFFQDLSYESWVSNIIHDICRDLSVEVPINELHDVIFSNVEILLNYKNSDMYIANQEFVDIIRRVASFTIYGDVRMDVDMSFKFNGLTERIMPFVINIIKSKNLTLDELLMYSIISGLSGLDLKGAPAASSAYSNTGIPMVEYYTLKPIEAAEKFINALDQIRNECDLGIFDYREFIDFLSTKNNLVWMTDDYIESYFDLLIIEKILKNYQINITVIPKSGYNGNDLCFNHLNEMLKSDMFISLQGYLKNGRLKVSSTGPKMGTANINKFSSEVIKFIENANVVFMKGCRIHEMLQGGLNKDTFSSYIVVRNLSEITSGFDASKKTVLFFHLSPNEYSFFGINYDDILSAKRIESTGKCHSVSTIFDHFKRKNCVSIENHVHEFSRLFKISKTYSGNIIPLYQELNMIAEKIESYTKLQYNQTSSIYQNLNRPDMNRIDTSLWESLFIQIKKCLCKELNEISLLDIGTGDGSSLEFLTNLGVTAHGIDNSEGFMNILNKKEKSGILSPNSFTMANMCNLPIQDASYDVVRMNASLLHLPIIAKGFTVDLALCEAARVLHPKGLIFILVKEGQGLVIIDTNEDLGKRIYQLYTHDLLDEVLLRNGFKTIKRIDQYEKRKGMTIHWIAHIAQKTEL